MVKRTVHLLGPAKIFWETGTPPRVRSPRTLALLGYLASGRRAFSRDGLAAFFWPDEPSEQGKGSLRRELHALNHLLPRCWQTDRRTIQFLPDESTWVDLHELERLEQRARWSEAAELVRGDFLEGIYLDENLEFQSWLLGEQERTRQRAERVLRHAAEEKATAGDSEMALRYAQRLLRLMPWHEAMHRWVMTLLAHQGQRSAALRQYHLCRRALKEELSVDVSPETVSLYDRLRTGAPLTPHNIPAPTTPLIGREKELSRLQAWLASPDTRLVTITGVGGLGKTRLALGVAHRYLDQALHPFPDGIFFVPLAALSDPSHIVTELAAALGRPLKSRESHSPRRQLLDYLQRKRLLLILDNFEHLLGGADLVLDILTNAPGVQILVTSRERLHLHQEQLLPLRGLTLEPAASGREHGSTAPVRSDAARLFLSAARRVRPDLQVSAPDETHLRDICHIVDGMPLALELAAAWADSYSLAAIAAEIQKGLSLFEADQRDLPARHRSMRAVFDASWQQLSGQEQNMLAALSVFQGGFTAETATAVVDASREHIRGLVGKSLLQVSDPDRYTMHELLRQYAAERGHNLNGAEGTRERHLEYFLALAEEAGANIRGPTQSSWVRRLEIEYHNVLAALHFATQRGYWSSAARLAAAMGEYWVIRGLVAEGTTWVDTILNKAADLSVPLKANLLTAAGGLAFEGGFYRRAKRLYEASLAAWREAGSANQVAELLTRLGHTIQQEHEYETAVTYLEESLQIYEALGDLPGIATALNRLGHAALLAGDYERSVALIQASLDHRRTLGDQRGMAACLNSLGELARAAGDMQAAEPLYEKCLELCRALGDKRCMAAVSHNLGYVRHYRGDTDRAILFFKEALALYSEVGTDEGVALVAAGLSSVAAARGRPSDAARLLAAAEAHFEAERILLESADRISWQRTREQLSQDLDQASFASEWALGSAMTPEEMRAQAHALLDLLA